MGEKVEDLAVRLAYSGFNKTPVMKARYVSEGNSKPVIDRRKGERRRRDRRKRH
jgi:hypothetical protein